MDKTLGYLRETLSNYVSDHSQGKHLYRKLTEGDYPSEEAFVQQLSSHEINFLNQILPKEISYAKREKDQLRARQLNEVYELLI